jgi:hypothetical protein
VNCLIREASVATPDIFLQGARAPLFDEDVGLYESHIQVGGGFLFLLHISDPPETVEQGKGYQGGCRRAGQPWKGPLSAKEGEEFPKAHIDGYDHGRDPVHPGEVGDLNGRHHAVESCSQMPREDEGEGELHGGVTHGKEEEVRKESPLLEEKEEGCHQPEGEPRIDCEQDPDEETQPNVEVAVPLNRSDDPVEAEKMHHRATQPSREEPASQPKAFQRLEQGDQEHPAEEVEIGPWRSEPIEDGRKSAQEDDSQGDRLFCRG